MGEKRMVRIRDINVLSETDGIEIPSICARRILFTAENNLYPKFVLNQCEAVSTDTIIESNLMKALNRSEQFYLTTTVYLLHLLSFVEKLWWWFARKSFRAIGIFMCPIKMHFLLKK